MKVLPAHRKHFRAFKGIYKRKDFLRLFGSMDPSDKPTTTKLVSQERIKQGIYARDNLMRSTSKPEFMTTEWSKNEDRHRNRSERRGTARAGRPVR